MLNKKILFFWIMFIVFCFLVGCSSATNVADGNDQKINIPKDSPTNSQSIKVEPTLNSEQTKLNPNGELKVHFIDVGQGASQLIIGSTGKTILIDAGNNEKAKLVVEYLKKQNINKIDILIGTHPDADHIGGLDGVINNFEIGKIYMPKVQSNTKTFEDVLTSIQKKGLKVSTAKAGLVLDWEPDTTLEMTAPVGDYSDSNDMSAVVHLTFGETSFLFSGDAESKSEHDMLNPKTNIKSDVLLVGHHGSKSSTSQPFLDAVNPSCAVIQVGKNNYGHPNDEVLKRLSEKGITTYRNDELGNIIFSSNGKDIIVNQGNGKCVKGERKSEPAIDSISAPPTPTVEPKLTPKPTVVSPSVAPKEQESKVYYKNCTAVKAAGAAPIYKGEPGYSTQLDRDGDGVACE